MVPPQSLAGRRGGRGGCGALVVTTVVAVLYADRQRYFATAQKKANDEITRLAERADEQRRNADQARADAVADSYRALVGETQAAASCPSHGLARHGLGQSPASGRHGRPSGTSLACAARPSPVWRLDLREVLRLEGQTQGVFGLDFSPDGKTLASTDYEGHVCVWELSDGRPLQQITDPAASATGWWTESAPLPFVRFRPGGNVLAYTNWSRRVEFLNWKAQTSVLPLCRDAQPRELAFDRKGELLGVSWADGVIGLYEAGTGTLRRLVATRAPTTDGSYMPLALSPDGAARSSWPGPCSAGLHSRHSGRASRDRAHAALIRSLTFSPDGKRLVSASEDRTAKLWDVRGGEEVLSFQGHTSSLTSIAFSPDGELVATSSDDQTVRLWAARGGQPLQTVHPGGTPLAVAFGPDGRRLAVGCAASVVVYQLAERLGRQLPSDAPLYHGAGGSPRKPLVAAASRQSVVSLEDLVTGEEIRTWSFAGLLGRLAFSPHGRVLAVAPFAPNPAYQPFGNHDVYLLDTETGNSQKLVLGDVGQAVAFDAGAGYWL